MVILDFQPRSRDFIGDLFVLLLYRPSHYAAHAKNDFPPNVRDGNTAKRASVNMYN